MEIAICDDDKGCCEQIENWIKDFSKRESVQINTHIFNNGEALIKSVKERGFFDMLFLDIELPNTNGVQLGTIIRSIETLGSNQLSIVFISAKTQYCMELFELEPLNFHHKPLIEDKIINDIKKVIARKNINEKVIKYQDNGIPKAIRIGDIIYIEANDKYLDVYTTDGERVLIRESLAKLNEQLQKYDFCQCHKSFLINLNYVKKYQSKQMIMINNIKVPIGRAYINDVKMCWAKLGED